MKRYIAGLGFLALSASAFAQSSVTLYGVLDEGLQLNTNDKNVVGGVNVWGRQLTLDSLSGAYGSRWGIKGVEDLGGGLKAIFDLESGINLNTGTFAQGSTPFGRQAYVGLSSAKFGTATLGRQYDSVSDYVSAFGFGLASYGSGAEHPGDIDNLAHTYRSNDTIKYASSDFSGLKFGGTVSLGGVAGQISQDSGYTMGASYVNGPIGLGVAYDFYKNPSNVGAVLNSNASAVAPATSTNFGSLNAGYLTGAHPATSWQVITAGGSYSMGAALVGVVYSNVKYGDIGNYNGATATFNDFEVNGKYQVSPEFFVAVDYNYLKGNAVSGDIGDQKYNQFAAMASYSVSKRTTVYLAGTYQVASGTNSLGAPAVADNIALGDSSNNHQAIVRLGFRQVF